MKINRWSLLALMFLALAGCTGPRGSAVAPAPRPVGPPVIAVESRLLDLDARKLPSVGDVAPDFEYTTDDGTTRKLSDLRGKKVLINFWASWCVPCREEIPSLQRAAEQYGDAVVILGVNKLEAVDVIAPFAREFAVSFPLIANPQGDISERYGAQNIPVSYFINSDGTIGWRQMGMMPYEFITLHLDQLK